MKEVNKMRWLDTFWGDLLSRVCIIVFVVGTFFSPIILWNYTQRLIKDSDTTATRGIFLKATLDLTQYKKLGLGKGLWGTYETYSRSDRHGETLVVYLGDSK